MVFDDSTCLVHACRYDEELLRVVSTPAPLTDGVLGLGAVKLLLDIASVRHCRGRRRKLLLDSGLNRFKKRVGQLVWFACFAQQDPLLG